MFCWSSYGRKSELTRRKLRAIDRVHDDVTEFVTPNVSIGDRLRVAPGFPRTVTDLTIVSLCGNLRGTIPAGIVLGASYELPSFQGS